MYALLHTTITKIYQFVKRRMEKLQRKKEPVSRLKSTLTEHNDEGRWQVKWVENEEMVLEETRGRAKELTKVSDDRNSKETQFFSCEAVL